MISGGRSEQRGRHLKSETRAGWARGEPRRGMRRTGRIFREIHAQRKFMTSTLRPQELAVL